MEGLSLLPIEGEMSKDRGGLKIDML